MKYFLKNRKIESNLYNSRKILLLLDFDGTISPIVGHPMRARLSARLRGLLKKCTENKSITIAIITGRSLNDITSRIGLKNIIYAANHGAEIRLNGKSLIDKGETARPILKKIGKRLSAELSLIKGLLVDNKGSSLAIHYRMSPRSWHKKIKPLFAEIVGPFLKPNNLESLYGKKLCEVRPKNSWNKGSASKWIWRKFAPTASAIYIGDDTTDEDAYRALKGRAVTINVGRKKGSSAEYFVRGIRDVETILKRLTISNYSPKF